MNTFREFRNLLQHSCTDYEEYCWVHACLAVNVDPFTEATDSPYEHSQVGNLHMLRRPYLFMDDRFHMIITGAQGMELFTALQKIAPDGRGLPEGTNVIYLETHGLPAHLNIFRHGNGYYDKPTNMGTMLVGDTPVSVYESLRATQN